MTESVVRQNYSADCEAAVNKQINVELYASYVYLSLATYFDRDDVALPGFSRWCRAQSKEEHEHATIFMKFQNERGGRVVFQDVQKPEKDDWGTALEAMQAALALEKFNNKSLLELHDVASKNNDPHMGDFLEDRFLREQVRSIKEIAGFVTGLKRAGPGLGEYLFDKETMQEQEQ